MPYMLPCKSLIDMSMPDLRRIEDCEPVQLCIRDGVHAAAHSCTPGLAYSVQWQWQAVWHAGHAPASLLQSEDALNVMQTLRLAYIQLCADNNNSHYTLQHMCEVCVVQVMSRQTGRF